MGEAAKNGLSIIEDGAKVLATAKSPYAKLYDSRAGLAAYYRYSPRQTPRNFYQGKPILSIVHWSVLMRMVYGTDSYAPITLPHTFKVLTPSGAILTLDELSQSQRNHGSHTTGDVELDSAVRELGSPDRDEVGLVWDTVFWRRCLYALTMMLTLLAAAFPAASQLLPKQLATIDSAARGPISTIVDALSALIPSFASPWKESLTSYPLEFGVLLIAIVLTLVSSQTLECWIHDRAHLIWHRNPVGNYRQWRAERRLGFGRSIAFCLVLLVAASIATLCFGRTDLGVGFVLVAALLTFAWGVSVIGHREKANAPPSRVRSTLALKTARAIRENPIIVRLYVGLTKKVIPLVFAGLLVAAGGLLANRAAFDTLSSAGLYCKGSPADSAAQGKETLGQSSRVFTTNQLCWASGLNLKKGHRYLITITTLTNHPTDRWFDRDVPTDVIGFPTDSLRHGSARPLTRWWHQDWFKPVARIGRFGNDEYVLNPIDDVAPYDRPGCLAALHLAPGLPIRTPIGDDLAHAINQCAPTPADRLVLHSEIKAKSDGEMFLYVNDAIAVIPGFTHMFFDNNSGSATIRVDRLTSRAIADESRAAPITQP
jgi:hypothetical protein